MNQWIEYSLIVLDGSGIQPYETLVPLGANFDGGYYVENGRYRGRLSGTEEQVANALVSLAIFGVKTLTPEEMGAIVERMVPTNTLQEFLSDEPAQYIGPVTFTEDLQIRRELSSTPF